MKHPLQPSPANWQLPTAYAHCQRGEQVTWPDGRVTIVVDCPTGALFLDKSSKAVVDPDSLDFRGKR